ncbi:hypothetical protein O1611_g1453 [Lasiodiplodia mahajangana]|uniref:Uncharacterized protein n=1 Tax=Lasiodiplodia mahajangana TaxID=1108764 RepID=A0ACC2JXK6_9PEZI|nr:hypothetical protein O1611_g1453 [Lasiodiplodia mahajangana]
MPSLPLLFGGESIRTATGTTASQIPNRILDSRTVESASLGGRHPKEKEKVEGTNQRSRTRLENASLRAVTNEGVL